MPFLYAGAGLTAGYALEVESEQVLTDADVLQMNITGGLPGSSVDGTMLYKVCLLKLAHRDAALQLDTLEPRLVLYKAF